jgi:hypothetical protein
MLETTFEELLNEFDESVRDKIRAKAEEYKATHVVVYRNEDLGSFQCGHLQALCIGPNNTVKTIDGLEGKAMPGNWRFYPKSYAKVGEV